jgi:hypothetical protein
MPSSLRIPDRYAPGLRALAALAEAEAERVREALTAMPSRLTTNRLSQHVVDAVPGLADTARDILEAVLSLVPLLDDEVDVSAQLALDVSASSDLDLDDQARGQLAERLQALLALEPVLAAARARGLMVEFERAFHDARVLTDLRPVFGRDPQEGAKAAAVVATLKIEAHEGTGPLREYYFAMDYADLLRLRAVVERALAKTAALKRLASQVNLPYWEYEEVDDATDS